jgi:glycosyltransferase involved in cell wall biosynthesis
MAGRPRTTIAVNAISAKVGGAATYLHAVLPELRGRLSGADPPRRLVVWRGSSSGDWPSGIEYREDARASERAGASGTLKRLLFDQVELPRLLRAERADVLFSSANFGPLRCPVRQVLLVRNTIYFDQTFLRRVPAKVRTNYILQRGLVLASIAASDVVLFPSEAMLNLVSEHMGAARTSFRVAPYGARHDIFRPPPEPVGLAAGADLPVRLLNVSLYCDQKNLGTLLSAVDSLDARDRGRYQLSLTAGFGRSSFASGAMYPAFSAERALYEGLHRRGLAEDVDWRSYTSLPDLYRSADLFVFSSYTESFGHPLVEAMATGLPIVASDIPVNRELCGEAAQYFSTFDPASCAATIRRVAEDADLRRRMSAAALLRARDFTWERHVDQLMEAFDGDEP